MFAVLIQMSLLIACGTYWKSHAPAHISAMAHRRALTDLVFYILLPALVLNVIWQAELNTSSLQISLLASSGVITGLILMWLSLKFVKTNSNQKGALLLAAAFPNATYLGLPVLTQILGTETQSTVLQYDYFACTPILLSFGMLLAQHFGDVKTKVNPIKELMKIPPLWALTIGLFLNFTGFEQPKFIQTILLTLSGGVVPLMLIVLGMSIPWNSLRLSYIKLLYPVVLISLILVPLAIFAISKFMGIESELLVPILLLAAMPTMIFGIVICDRYQLDSELYAAAVTLTTIASLITLPAWSYYLGVG